MSLRRVCAIAFILALPLLGCATNERAHTPAAPAAPGTIEVVGTLVTLKDDRPADGGVDLTLETAPGVQQLVHVPSAFRPPPRDSILAMHAVVDSAKVGDRLRALGARGQDGALRAQVLERVAGSH